MPVTPETEAKLVELLAEIYARIPWQKIRTSKNPHDIWNHRLRSAATRATLGEFVSRLANAFGLQSVSARATVLVEELRSEERWLLDLVYREHIPIAMRAVLRAQELKALRRGNAEQLTLETTTPTGGDA